MLSALLLAAGPATAAGCSTADGVTVVVDFHQLGGGVQTGCDSSGGGEAASRIFAAAGHGLTYTQRQPGFVCRVDKVPASDPCVNASPQDAYWSLWWTDGTSSTWTYSSLGVGSLQVPDGGSVAFSWSSGSGNHPPGVAPAVHPADTPTTSAPTTSGPTHGPTRAPTHDPTHEPTGTAGPAPGSTTPTVLPPTPTAPVTASDGSVILPPRLPSGSPSAAASASPAGPTGSPPPGDQQGGPDHPDSPQPSTAQTSDISDSPGDSSGGLPGWVPIAVIVVLSLVAASTTVVRRRTRP